MYRVWGRAVASFTKKQVLYFAARQKPQTNWAFSPPPSIQQTVIPKVKNRERAVAASRHLRPGA